MLLKFEMKKLIRKRSVGLLSLATLIVTTVLTLLPLLSAQYYTQDAMSTGLQAVKQEKKITLENAALLTDTNVEEVIRQVQSLYRNAAHTSSQGGSEYLEGSAYWQNIAPKEGMLNLIAKAYAPISQTVDYSWLNTLDLSAEPLFYQKIDDQRRQLVSQPGRHLSAAQQEFWLKKAAGIQIPFEYSWFKGWSWISSSMELMIICILLICLILIPVFSQEYSSGMDSLILGSKFGKNRLVRAKIAAAYLTGTALFLVNVLVMAIISLGCYGMEGWNLPIQTANPFIPYPITFWQADLISLGLCLCVLWGMIGLSLFFSAAFKSSYQAAVLAILIGLVPVFLMPSSTAGFLNKILYLMPYQALIPDFAKYLTYQLGPFILDGASVKALLYLLVTMISVPAAAAKFRRHIPA